MGYLRFILALTVTIRHLLLLKLTGTSIAVVGFYCMSGFLITRIIHETYGNSWRGKIYFLLNRLTRIYPIYYMCLIVGLICLYGFGDSGWVISSFTKPSSWADWSPQIFIFGLNIISKNFEPLAMNNIYPIRILPPAWSLNVELLYYIFMGVVIGTSLRRMLLWCAVSIGISGYLLWNHYSYDYHYFTIYNSSIFFAAGALAYHSCRYASHIVKLPPALAVILGGSLTYIPYILGYSVYENLYFIYLSIPVFMYVLVCLYSPEYADKREQFFGNISYPLFLVHWPLSTLFVHWWPPFTFGYWAAAVSLSLLVSAGIVFINAKLFNEVRNRLRDKARCLRNTL